MLSSGACAGYVFLYAVWYFISELEITGGPWHSVGSFQSTFTPSTRHLFEGVGVGGSLRAASRDSPVDVPQVCPRRFTSAT